MKVALVHDWLIHMRGGERVLESLAEVFPEATIYTLFLNRSRLSPPLQRMKIKTSMLQRFHGIRRYYRWLLPLLPFFIQSLRIEEAEVVISSSHCVAKGVQIPSSARHLCYCFTPMRYLWGFEKEYFGNFPRPLLSLLKPILDRLRAWDRSTSRQVDQFFCISETVKERIRNIYEKEATVIYPPVDTEFFKPDPAIKRDDYYLVVSALTPYKRIDLVIEAFNHWERRLLIVGDGPLRTRYQRLAKVRNIRFLGRVPDEELHKLYCGARALIFPQEEDFGIIPLEAQACGLPVIAFAKGGALETVKEGVFFYDQSLQAIRQAVLEFEDGHFDSEALRRHAQQFDKTLFKNKIRQVVEHAYR